MAAALSGSQMPQPNTFTRSKDDILSALSFYFGQPVSPEKLKDYNEHHAATYHFPDAYLGQNTQLRDVRATPPSQTPNSFRLVGSHTAQSTLLPPLAVCRPSTTSLRSRRRPGTPPSASRSAASRAPSSNGTRSASMCDSCTKS